MMLVVLEKERTAAPSGKNQEHQACGLQPEGIEGTTDGDDERFAAGKDGVEKPVFLYNGLQSIFDT